MTPAEKKINDDLTRIWKNYVTSGKYKISYVPLYRTNLRYENILFVGLNPSFNTGHPSTKSYAFDGRSGSNAFEWDSSWSLNTDPTRIDSLAKHERSVTTPRSNIYYKRYFKIFDTIMDELKVYKPHLDKWEDTDLFFF